MPPPKRTAEDMVRHIQDNVHIEPNSYCWLWLMCVNDAGYGMISDVDAKPRRVHRVSWRIFRGEIPKGMHVCHKCDVRSCCNPDHLFLGTDADNHRDRDAKGRHYRPKLTHCKRGHAYAGDNLIIKVSKTRGRSRLCRACVDAWHKDNATRVNEIRRQRRAEAHNES